jgi:hypothetical protein
MKMSIQSAGRATGRFLLLIAILTDNIKTQKVDSLAFSAIELAIGACSIALTIAS